MFAWAHFHASHGPAIRILFIIPELILVVGIALAAVALRDKVGAP